MHVALLLQCTSSCHQQIKNKLLVKTVDARQVVFKLWGDGVTCCSDVVRSLIFLLDRSHRHALACLSAINCNKLLQCWAEKLFAACMFKPKCSSSCDAMKCSTCTSSFFLISVEVTLVFSASFTPSIVLSLLSCSFLPHLSRVTPPPSSLHSLNLSFEVICEALLSLRSSLPTLKVSQELLQSWTLLKSFTCVLLTLWSFVTGQRRSFDIYTCYRVTKRPLGRFLLQHVEKRGGENLDVTLFSNAALPLSYRLLWRSEWRWPYFRTTSGWVSWKHL